MTEVNTTTTSTASTSPAKCSQSVSRWPSARRITSTPACPDSDTSCARCGDGCEQRFGRRVLGRERTPQFGFHLAADSFAFGFRHRMECNAQTFQLFQCGFAFFSGLATLVACRFASSLDHCGTDIVGQLAQTTLADHDDHRTEQV